MSPETWELEIETALDDLNARVSKLEASATPPSTWTPVWQDVVKRLPWDKAGYVLAFGALLAVNKNPELRDIMVKALGLK